MHAVIFTGGKLRPGPAVSEALAQADLIIAADSGADSAMAMGARPAVVIGDLDSINPTVKKQLQQADCHFEISPAEKDESDTELAINYAVSLGATAITILGGIEGGDRLDHILANVFLLTQSPVPTTLVSGGTTVWVTSGPGESRVSGGAGDTLSLLPLTSAAVGVTTKGLKYSLAAQDLQFGKSRGLSNVLTAPVAHVSLDSGQLLFVHTRPILT